MASTRGVEVMHSKSSAGNCKINFALQLSLNVGKGHKHKWSKLETKCVLKLAKVKTVRGSPEALN
jgi:hypothetical protein